MSLPIKLFKYHCRFLIDMYSCFLFYLICIFNEEHKQPSPHLHLLIIEVVGPQRVEQLVLVKDKKR